MVGDCKSQLTDISKVPLNAFEDLLFDVLGLKDNCLEADLEQAILLGIINIFSCIISYAFCFPWNNCVHIVSCRHSHQYTG